jgi:hypothetical membrane protein
MLYTDRRLAGVFAFTGGVQCLIGIVVAEDLYPGYSVSMNYISDLGATCRTTCVIEQPASAVFDSTVILLGLFVIAGSYFLYRSSKRRLLPSLLILSAIGSIGVGVFPETTGIFHVIASLIVFLFGGLSALASYQILESPINYLALALGALTLLALVLFSSGYYLGMGPGGMERMIAYPALLWLVGFGAFLMKS